MVPVPELTRAAYQKLRKQVRLRTRLATIGARIGHSSREGVNHFAAATLSRWDARRIGAANSVALGFAGWKPGVGGVRNHIQAIRKFSAHNVRVFPGPLATRLTKRRHYSSSLWKRGSTVLKPFGLLHSHVDPHFTNACRDARSSRTRWVHTYHTLYFAAGPDHPIPAWKAEINQSLLEVAQEADARISVSPWLQTLLKDRHGIDTICIPNGVDVSLCDSASGGRFARESGLSGFVVYVGSLDPVKNPEMFVELGRACPDLNFVMIGKNLTRGSLEAQFGSKLSPNLVAIGPLSHRSTLDAIAASRCLVMPSRVEGFPTALLEAMALGKSVVATNNAGCKDAIGDEAAGVLFEPGDVDGARSALREALDRPELGSTASRRVRALFDWRVVAAQLDAVYSDQIARCDA